MSVAAAVAGSLASGLISSAGQYVANQQLIENQNKWNDISVHLADTAHQREVKDLLSAGINPVLTASSSGSAVPTLGTAQIGNVGEGLASGMNSAARVLNPLVQSQVNVNSAQAQNLINDGELKKAQADAIKFARQSVTGLPEKANDAWQGFKTWVHDNFVPSNSAKTVPVRTWSPVDKAGNSVPDVKLKPTARMNHETSKPHTTSKTVKKRRHN